MDADDRSQPARLERQVGFLDAHPEIDLVGTSFDVIDVRGRPHQVVAALPSADEVQRDLFVRSPFGHGSVMMRRDALLAVGGYNAAFWPADDYDLWRRVLRGGRGANLTEILYDYRRHEENSSIARQIEMAREIREEIWAAGDPPPLTLSAARDDLASHRAVAAPLREPLVTAYLSCHTRLLLTAVRRHRWGVLRQSAPALLYCAVLHTMRRLRHLRRGQVTAH